jgi:hypothetical protein
LHIEPSQVRLVPTINDPYRWKYPPRLQKLFTKNMSDQSIGVYKILCREIEVKKSIIAVAQDESGGLDEGATSDDEVRQSTVYYFLSQRLTLCP